MRRGLSLVWRWSSCSDSPEAGDRHSLCESHGQAVSSSAADAARRARSRRAAAAPPRARTPRSRPALLRLPRRRRSAAARRRAWRGRPALRWPSSDSFGLRAGGQAEAAEEPAAPLEQRAAALGQRGVGIGQQQGEVEAAVGQLRGAGLAQFVQRAARRRRPAARRRPAPWPAIRAREAPPPASQPHRPPWSSKGEAASASWRLSASIADRSGSSISDTASGLQAGVGGSVATPARLLPARTPAYTARCNATDALPGVRASPALLSPPLGWLGPVARSSCLALAGDAPSAAATRDFYFDAPGQRARAGPEHRHRAGAGPRRASSGSPRRAACTVTTASATCPTGTTRATRPACPTATSPRSRSTASRRCGSARIPST